MPCGRLVRGIRNGVVPLEPQRDKEFVAMDIPTRLSLSAAAGEPTDFNSTVTALIEVAGTHDMNFIIRFLLIVSWQVYMQDFSVNLHSPRDRY